MGDRIAQLRKWAAEQRKHHSQHTADFYEETADEIERLRAELTKRKEAIDPFDFEYTAFKAGVKAGLEAAAQWADREKATYVKWVGQCAGHDERYMAADAIRGIDPASVTRKGGADE